MSPAEVIPFQERIEKHLTSSETEMRGLRESIDHLSEAINEQTGAIQEQTVVILQHAKSSESHAVETKMLAYETRQLAEVVRSGQQTYATAIPVRLVFYIIAVLSMAILGLKAGEELLHKF
jgi:predicted Zn-dependent protease